MSIKKVLLGLIVVFAFILRVYGIDKIPPALSWDEVSIGYNAYSILKTGRDEHGKIFPLDSFAAYGDYKPPFSIYLTVPFVALFGLNEFSVRLPSAIFGTFTVLFTYFTISELFSKDVYQFKTRISRKFNSMSEHLNAEKEAMAYVSCGLIAISPWHINLSRAGFEANIALFFVVLGIFLILRAARNQGYWIVAWLPFIFAIYTFNSSRYFVFIFSFFLLFYNYRSIKTHIKTFTVGIIVASLLLLPILPHLFSREARLRFEEVNIFTDSAVIVSANERIARENNTFLAKIINNRRIGFTKSYINHFLDTFQPDFLFIKGDRNPKFSTQDIGQLYLIEAPLLVLGILLMFSIQPKIAVFLSAWVISAIIPAAAARETPHALRLLNSLPAWQVFISYGVLTLFTYIRSKLNSKLFEEKNHIIHKGFAVFIVVFVTSAYGFQFIYYLYNYYHHYPRLYSAEWQYGYKQVFEYVRSVEQSYDYIFISDKIGRPYMYGLFYMQYDPALFIQQKKSYFDAAGFYHVDSFGKYYFGNSLPTNTPPKTLIVGDPSWVDDKNKIKKKIEYLNGDVTFAIY